MKIWVDTPDVIILYLVCTHAERMQLQLIKKAEAVKLLTKQNG